MRRTAFDEWKPFISLVLVLLFLGFVWPTTVVIQPGGWGRATSRLFSFLRTPFETDTKTGATDDLSEKANPKIHERQLEERVKELNDRDRSNASR